jgi:hypothetical protein
MVYFAFFTSRCLNLSGTCMSNMDMFKIKRICFESLFNVISSVDILFFTSAVFTFNTLLKLHATWRSNNYQFYSLWFDPIGARTHDLPHLRHAC